MFAATGKGQISNLANDGGVGRQSTYARGDRCTIAHLMRASYIYLNWSPTLYESSNESINLHIIINSLLARWVYSSTMPQSSVFFVSFLQFFAFGSYGVHVCTQHSRQKFYRAQRSRWHEEGGGERAWVASAMCPMLPFYKQDDVPHIRPDRNPRTSQSLHESPSRCRAGQPSSLAPKSRTTPPQEAVP